MISKYTFNDIEAINNLGSIINPKFADLFKIAELNEKEIIYVYKINKEIVGFIHYMVNYEVADLLNVIVINNFRSKGIGSKLMSFMFDSLPKEVNRVMLEVSEKNLLAIKLYNKFDFEIINIRPNYYGNEAALVMERKI